MAEPESGPTVLSLTPGVRVVRVDGDVAFVADHLRLRLSGNVGEFVADRLVPLLDGSRDRRAILATLDDVDAAELNEWLDRLVGAGAIDERTVDPELPGFFRASQLHEGAVAHVRERRVMIVGGGEIERQLREALAAVEIRGVTVLEEEPASKEQLAEAVAGSDVVVHAGGSSRLRSAHWVNQVALADGLRALFARVEGHRAVVGPLVLPGEGACFLCWRMRALANENDYETAMAWEQDVASRPGPDLDAGPGLPALAPLVAAVGATEILKVLAAYGTPATASRVWELDALTLETRLRPVLQRPDCPACRKKGLPPPAQPPLAGLRGAAVSRPDLQHLHELAVDDRTGIVRRLGLVPRDASEPERPLVVRAELANHRFVGTDAEPFTIASGKGMLAAEAETSALGEALERYGSSPWQPERIVRGRLDSLDIPAVEPAALVLYAEQQYEDLPYSPWRRDATIGWITARRLGDGAEVAVPTLAVFMDYGTPNRSEFLFQVTSNGLAAGSTLASAVLAGLYEVLERDAFVLGWLRRLPGARLAPGSVGDAALLELERAWGRRGVELRLVLLETDLPVPVVAAFGVEEVPADDRPAVVVGLGANVDPRVAARKAALEVGQIRPALRGRLRDPETRARLDELLADPARVSDLEDHDLLYAHPSQLGHLAHWLDAPAGELGLNRLEEDEDPAATLEGLVSALATAGHDVFYVNLTPGDLETMGVYVVRVLVPGLQPIHFGAAETRLGGTRALTSPTPVALEHLNLHPHPLA